MLEEKHLRLPITPSGQSQQVLDCVHGVVHCFFEEWKLVRREGIQDIGDDCILAGWPSDTQADSGEITGAEMFDDRPYAIMASVATLGFHFDAAQQKVEIVVDDNDILGGYGEFSTEAGYRFAACIHICERLGKCDLMRAYGPLSILGRGEMSA